MRRTRVKVPKGHATVFYHLPELFPGELFSKKQKANLRQAFKTFKIALPEANVLYGLMRFSRLPCIPAPVAGSLIGVISMASLATGQVVYTQPAGYARVTVDAAPAAGQTSLSAISATFLGKLAFNGVATINSDFDADPDNDAGTNDSAQTISLTGATLTAGQLTSKPHLIYLPNENGAEEAFLITSHDTAGNVTVSTTFDLLAVPDAGTGLTSRFPASLMGEIREAHTIGSLFGATAVEVPFKTGFLSVLADNLYLWNGSGWVTYFHDGNEWIRIGGSGGSAVDDVVFPDEGIFVLRRDTTDAVIRFFGDVPTKPQVSTVPGAGLTLISTRFPVPTTIDKMGFENLPNWKKFFISSNADRVFAFVGQSWITYFHDGTSWQIIAPSGSGLSVTDPLPANSALFVSRLATDEALNSGAEHELPYPID